MSHSSTTTKFAWNLLLAVASLGLGLVLAEFALRIFVPVHTGTSWEYRVPDPKYGWTLKPATRYMNVMREKTVEVTYNTKGWRDREHSLDKPDGVIRIVVLGDSFMEAYSVDLKHSFSTRLESWLNAHGISAEVINLGVGGFGSLQELLVYEDFGRQYKPDLVVQGVYLGNDLRDNSLELERLRDQDWDEILSRPYLLDGPDDDWNVIRMDYKAAKRLYRRKLKLQQSLPEVLADESSLYKTMLLVKQRVGQMFEQNREGSGEKHAMDAFHMFGMHFCSEPPEYSRAWDKTSRILKKLSGEVQATGARLVLFSVPSIYEVDPEYRRKAENMIPDPSQRCLDSVPGYARLKGVADQLNIELVDILPEFRRVSADKGTNLFRRSDQHWNEAGHKIAARMVGETLLRSGLGNGPVRLYGR